MKTLELMNPLGNKSQLPGVSKGDLGSWKKEGMVYERN